MYDLGEIELNKMWLRMLAIGLCLLSLMDCSIAKEFVVSGDRNGDNVVSDSELQEVSDSYINGTITKDQLEIIKTIHDKYPRKANDTLGRTITIWKPLERIVIFDHGMAEDFRTLNAQDKLVAIDKCQWRFKIVQLRRDKIVHLT
jgi:ABC-type Fe3+-hydroxamate transport system substrate-binding protein